MFLVFSNKSLIKYKGIFLLTVISFTTSVTLSLSTFWVSIELVFTILPFPIYLNKRLKLESSPSLAS